MLWPVLLDTAPRDTTWSLGEQVSTRLRWLDAPDLPEDLLLHQIVVRAGTLLDVDGQPWAQLIEAGDLRAIREGDHRAGDVTLDGCLGFDAFLSIIGDLPVTVGIVRRVRVVHDLHDRGTSEWIRRPGGARLTDVPDACPTRLRDEPSFGEPVPDDWEPEPGTLQIMSPEEYFRSAREHLPAEQWQARGFLVDLEVAGPA
ncbi:hypothetical protein FHR83_005548 [Actinoplanes campanulatus]|uniref:Uncharacterized protein n=1 Tax=Actinoplanes campanulatus TaxID=113559 RepID=A0A7W5AL37_9ACTN|nr:hypothetical protein [Actinoplanes campanulatus]MBB3097864.1 hypothetical protein [Actinoplanes campanulatus]GGN22384.1 hypothetical protein GCM10010109_36950 [Actinoplanes campanulatus]GID34555.1 hypothetical protein Aca09nite_10610 [Actinoplanes campanulatus]